MAGLPDQYSLSMLRLFARQSRTAKDLAEAKELALMAISSYPDIDFHMLAQCLRIDEGPQVGSMILSVMPGIDKLVRKYLASNKDDNDGMLCYYMLLQPGWSKRDMVAYLRTAIEKHPNDFIFYELLASILATMNQFKECIALLGTAIELKSDRPVLYNLRAVYARRAEEEDLFYNAMEDWHTFVTKADIHHRDVPFAHYRLASCFLDLDMPTEANKHHLLGLEAEKRRLPFFDKVKDSTRDNFALLENGANSDRYVTMRRQSAYAQFQDETEVKAGLLFNKAVPSPISRGHAV